jgi:ankyrin repeat protein
MSTIDIISNSGKVSTINSDNPILNSGYFGLINKSSHSDLDFELLELIFSDNYDVSVDKLIEYIPILSSLCLDDKARQSYLKLFSMINENNHELINELMDDMINYFNVEEIDKMPDLVASKFVIKIINDADINKIFIDAARIGYIKTIKKIISKNADIHVADDYAIRLASENGHLEIVKFLFEKGANIHSATKNFIKPYIYITNYKPRFFINI